MTDKWYLYVCTNCWTLKAFPDSGDALVYGLGSERVEAWCECAIRNEYTYRPVHRLVAIQEAGE